MNESIKQILALQDQDLELDRLQAEIAAIPGKVNAIKKTIQDQKSALEAAKKDLNQFQLAKKQAEMDLETQETNVRKHAAGLNGVKTNEAYKALLGEIEKAKTDKSKIEDQILLFMEQIDQAGKVWKEKESISKNEEGALHQQISDWEAKQKMLEAQVIEKKAQRGSVATSLPMGISESYERLRQNRKGAAVVPIVKEQCSGCHMKVSQNLINEVRRGQKIMTCESCSRIVYLTEEPAKATGV